MVDLGRVQFFGETASPRSAPTRPPTSPAFQHRRRHRRLQLLLAQRSLTGCPRRRRHAGRGSLMQLPRHGIVRDFAITPQFSQARAPTSPSPGASAAASATLPSSRVLPWCWPRPCPWLPAGFVDGLAAPISSRPARTWGEHSTRLRWPVGRSTVVGQGAGAGDGSRFAAQRREECQAEPQR